MLDAGTVEIVNTIGELRDLVVISSAERLDSFGKVLKSVDAVAKLISPTLPRAINERLDRYCKKWMKRAHHLPLDMMLSEEEVKEAIGDVVDLYGDCSAHARQWQKLG